MQNTNHSKSHKTHNRDDKEDRAFPYRNWAWNLGGRCYANDIDLVSYRFDENGVPYAIACLELTRRDAPRGSDPGITYLPKVLRRYSEEAQGKFIREMARRLNCEPWAVVFSEHMHRFWVLPLNHTHRGWREHNLEEHEHFHRVTLMQWHQKYHGD